MRYLALTIGCGFQTFGQRVGHTDPDAMQAAGEAVSTPFAFFKLAARMQLGKYQLDHRCVFFWVHAKRNTTAIVINGDGTIGMQYDLDFFTVTCQGFIGRVVQHFLNNVQRIVGAGVHARTLLDGLQSFQDADGAFRIFTAWFCCHSLEL